jgi:hypothetical protein
MYQQTSRTTRAAAERRWWNVTSIIMLVAITLSGGCLSIGGKTYTSDPSPETQNRIAAVEKRVGVLEQAVFGAAPLGSRVQVTDMPTP